MRYCRTCGRQMPDRATFCPGCGTAVAGKQKQKKKKTALWLILLLAVALIATGVVLWQMGVFEKAPVEPPVPEEGNEQPLEEEPEETEEEVEEGIEEEVEEVAEEVEEVIEEVEKVAEEEPPVVQPAPEETVEQVPEEVVPEAPAEEVTQTPEEEPVQEPAEEPVKEPEQTKPAAAKSLVVTPPWRTVYMYESNADLSGMVVTMYYDDGTSKTISSGYSVSSTALPKSGSLTITVSYQGFSASFTVDVITRIDVSADGAYTFSNGATFASYDAMPQGYKALADRMGLGR